MPPLANFREVDPALGELNYSRGGRHGLRYALRLAAGFGSQISLTLLEHGGRRPNERFLPRYREWLRETVGCDETGLEVIKNVLRVREGDRAASVQLDRGLPEARHEPSLAKDVPAQGDAEHSRGPARDRAEQAQKPEAIFEESRNVQSGGSRPAGAAAQEVLALVAEKTGYPEDMLDLDLDLEADLGIDTIKQAELFGDLRRKFGLPPAEKLNIADFPTLRHIIRWVDSRRRLSEAENGVRPLSKSKSEAGREGSSEQIQTLVPVLRELPQEAEGRAQLRPARVLVAGGPQDLVRLVSQRLEAAGADVRSIPAAQILTGDVEWVKSGAVSDWDLLNLLGLESDGEKSVAGTFNLYRLLASRGNPMPRRLLAAISTGGSFLLRRGHPVSETLAAAAGAVCGAASTTAPTCSSPTP